jgi:hypothetical protein
MPSIKNAVGQLAFAIRVSIKYDQLIMFENFYEYINAIWRNLKLKLRGTPDILILCCVDPQYSLLHYVETSLLENVPLSFNPTGNTRVETGEVQILKQRADNLSIKSINDVYTKRFIQIKSYEKSCSNTLAADNSAVDVLTNNLSYGHTNITFKLVIPVEKCDINQFSGEYNANCVVLQK